MKLWHTENARSFRVLWALEELGLDYDLQMLSFPPRAFHKDYKDENPLGTVPLLVDGDTRLTESCAIIHYLSARHAGGRLSVAADHPEYGAYLNWLHHGEATLTFPQTLVLRYAFFEPEERRNPQVAEDYWAWFLARLRLAEATLADGRPFLLKEGFTMADIAVGYAMQVAVKLPGRDALPPSCLAWFETLSRRDAFRRAQEVQARALAETGARGLVLQPT
ncbi:glutathione S-transferase family protein [Chachezhania sediminis]|uniref:glutathione S-transferase family protein n=1 Tax=Chachezhania sediminis TaxID=2599291 RepID=UPI00131C8D90|nr:glutathione S-transferase family protein [Chachezhania sediminis]